MVTLCAVSWSVLAQTASYSGTVVDASNGEPLIGATVMPIGGGQGTATDLDGKFTLVVPTKVHTAKVSYVGYKDQTVTLGNDITVRLVSTSTSLDDVVVIAYGTGTKESLTGSVAVVGAKQIEDRPVSSVTAALEGNAPGVMVDNSTTRPGESPTIRIRGFNSINGNNSPLYVVDGVVYDGDIADINPADIESMSVLKDAASCALYGNRGANGVILINTKRAKGQGKVDVNLQMRLGMYERGLSFYDKLGANEWMETSLAAWARGQVTRKVYPTFDEAIIGVKDQFVGTYMKGQNIYDLPASELFNENGKLMGHILPGYSDLNWWDAISRTGFREEYNINASGATEKFDAFASIGYLKENGYMLGTDFKRFNGRAVANYQPVSYFKTGVNIAASYSKGETGNVEPSSMGTTDNPFLTEFNAPVLPYYAHNEDGSIQYDGDGQPVWNTNGLANNDNIAWVMRLNKHNYTSNSLNGNIYGTAIIPYGFELTLNASLMNLKQNGMDYNNNLIGAQKPSGGLITSTYNLFTNSFNQSLTWNHDYGDNNIDVLLSHENYSMAVDQTSLSMQGQVFDDNTTLNNFETYNRSSEGIAKVHTESYLGRVRYNYDQRYFAEASLRRDGSSRFTKKNRWGTFWSVGASWIISKEKFLSEATWLNYLKLRAAYGAVGNDASAGYYSYWTTYELDTYDDVMSAMPSSIGADNLKWESTKTFDIALEGSLFDDRFTFSVGYFNKINADLLFPVVIPASNGTPAWDGNNFSVMQNIGTMQNSGWELQFGVDILRNADWYWHFEVDATFLKNRIKSLPGGHDLQGQGLFLGRTIYERYTYEYAGVDNNTGHALYLMHPDSPRLYQYTETGEKVYNQAGWDNTVAQAKATGHYFVGDDGREYTDRVDYAYPTILGTALPTVNGSFSTQLAWKGISLNLLFTYSLGGKSYNSNYQSLMGFSSSNQGALHRDVLNSWTHAPEGIIPNQVMEDGTILLYTENIRNDINPVADTELSQYNNAGSSRWIIRNDYLTLKNLTIGYDLPKKWMNALKLQNINIGMSIDNVFIASRQKGFNPQYSFSGGQGAYYVPSRVYSFQLAVKF